MARKVFGSIINNAQVGWWREFAAIIASEDSRGTRMKRSSVLMNGIHGCASRSNLGKEDRSGELRADHRGTLSDNRCHVHLWRRKRLPRRSNSSDSKARSLSPSPSVGASNTSEGSRLLEQTAISFSSYSSVSTTVVDVSSEDEMSLPNRFLSKIGARLKTVRNTSSKIIDGCARTLDTVADLEMPSPNVSSVLALLTV